MLQKTCDQRLLPVTEREFTDSEIGEMLDEIVSSCKKQSQGAPQVEMKNICTVISVLQDKHQVESVLLTVIRAMMSAYADDSVFEVTVHDFLRRKDAERIGFRDILLGYCGVSIKPRPIRKIPREEESSKLISFLSIFFESFDWLRIDTSHIPADELAQNDGELGPGMFATHKGRMLALRRGVTISGLRLICESKNRISITIVAPTELPIISQY
jgi:hypothetical protein